MPRGEPSPKIAITVSRQVHDMAVALAKRDGVSLSAWITEALRRRIMIEDGLEAVREFELEHGAFTDEERAAARRRVAEQEAMVAEGRKKRRSA